MKKNVILAACVALFACSCNQNDDNMNKKNNQPPAPQPKKSCCEVEKPSQAEVSQQSAKVALPEVKVEPVIAPVEKSAETK